MQHGSSVPLALSIRLSDFEARSDVSEDASLSDTERVSENQVRARTYIRDGVPASRASEKHAGWRDNGFFGPLKLCVFATSQLKLVHGGSPPRCMEHAGHGGARLGSVRDYGGVVVVVWQTGSSGWTAERRQRVEIEYLDYILHGRL